MNGPAHFDVLYDGDYIVLRDLGPWDKYLTITNDAERVLYRVAPRTRRVFYYDSAGEYGELVHRNGVFVRFATADPPVEAEQRFGGV